MAQHSRPLDSAYWRLLAVALDPGRPTPELYGILREAEKDTPLMVDGRIVFFTDPARAPELTQKHGGAWVTDPMDVAKPSFWCDVTQALHFLSAGGIDTSASIVNAVNVLLDLVRQPAPRSRSAVARRSTPSLTIAP